MVTPRNKVGAILAIIGGVLLIVGGGVGMVALLGDLQGVVEDKISDNPAVTTLFKVLILFAALGGIAVILGGILIYLEFPLPAKILITLGAGIGIVGLIIGIVLAFRSGNAEEYFNGILATIAGLGVVLAIAASLMASK